jgi:flagellar biosynthesis component FlhA
MCGKSIASFFPFEFVLVRRKKEITKVESGQRNVQREGQNVEEAHQRVDRQNKTDERNILLISSTCRSVLKTALTPRKK